MTSSPAPPGDVPIRRFTKVDWLDPPPPNQPALPVPLINGAIAINEAKRAIHVGGYAAAAAESVNAVAEFEFTSRVWSSVGIERFPYKVSEGCLASIGSKYYYYGGWDDEFVRGDVHVLNCPPGTGEAKGAQWLCLFRGAYQGKRAERMSSTDGKPFPKSRRGASMTAGTLAGRSVLFIFGGFSGETRLNDLWAFDVDTSEWIFIQTHALRPSVAAIREAAALRLTHAASLKPPVTPSYFTNLGRLATNPTAAMIAASAAAAAAGNSTSNNNGNATNNTSARGGMSPAHDGGMMPPASAQMPSLQAPNNGAMGMLSAQMSPSTSPLNGVAAGMKGGSISIAAGGNSNTSIAAAGQSQLLPPGGISVITGGPPAATAVPATPTPRDGAAMAFDALQSRLLLFGGYKEGCATNDVYELKFDPSTAVSRGGGGGGNYTATGSSLTMPHDTTNTTVGGSTGRNSFAATNGWADDEENDDGSYGAAARTGLVVEERFAQWQRLSTTNPPLPRHGCFALVNGQFFVVGYGTEMRSGPSKLLFQLNLVDYAWTICNLEGDENNEARAGAAVGTQQDNKKSLVLGGMTADGRYLFSGFEIDWERPEVVGGKGKR